MITVIAEIKVKPGRREAVLAAIEALRPNVLAKDGCAANTLCSPTIKRKYRGVKPLPTPFLCWNNGIAFRHLEQHQQTAHMDAHRANIRDDVMDVIFHILERRAGA